MNDNKLISIFEKKVFLIVNILASIFAAIAFVGDLLIRSDSWTAINSFIPLVVFSTISILTYKGVDYRKLSIPFILSSLFSITTTFFLFGGYQGSVSLIAIALIVAIAIFSKTNTVRMTVVMTILLISALFFAQKIDPDLVVKFKNEDERFYDYWISSIAALGMIYILVERIVSQYRKYQLELIEDKEKLAYQSDLIKQKNAALSELNYTKDKFFSIISHDLKNPLSTFKDGLKILKSDFEHLPIEDVSEIINTLKKNADTTYELLENLLSWSRIQTGHFPFSPEKFLLNGLISFNIGLFESQAKKKDIDIKYEDLDVYQAYADQNMISTVFRNLISNAIKFTPTNGEIKILINKGLHELKISISDSGTGMSEEKISTLFKIETAESEIGTSGESGTGLGLILCKEFIDKNNGTLEVRSELGKGSIFTFTVPTIPPKMEHIGI